VAARPDDLGHGRPVRVQVAADSTELYVTENDPAPDGRREVRAYPIRPDGTLGPYRLLLAFGADPGGAHRGPFGMCLAGRHLLVSAGGAGGGAGPMVYRLEPSGRVVGTYPVPEDPVDCIVLGGDLYVTTAAGSLLRATGVEPEEGEDAP
jgi:gluconolactonase